MSTIIDIVFENYPMKKKQKELEGKNKEEPY